MVGRLARRRGRPSRWDGREEGSSDAERLDQNKDRHRMGPNPILFRSGPPERPNTIKVTSFPPPEGRSLSYTRHPASGIRDPPLTYGLAQVLPCGSDPEDQRSKVGVSEARERPVPAENENNPQKCCFLNWRVFVTFVFETYRLGPLLLFRPGAA